MGSDVHMIEALASLAPLIVEKMKCTFYVDGEILDPWVEDLAHVPAREHALVRQGAEWRIARVWGSDEDASVLLTLASDEQTPRPNPRRRKLSYRGGRS